MNIDKDTILSLVGDIGVEIYTYREIDSTNTEAKRKASSGISTPAVFIADRQSAGRGRMGRSFYSPENTGLYLSFLYAPSEKEGNTVGLTSAVAVAVRRAILKSLSVDTRIKWVNDLYLDRKKVSGILAECFELEGEGKREKRIVIGVGINICTDSFPEELREIAGAVADNDGNKHELAAELILQLVKTVETVDSGDREGVRAIMEEYRQASLVLGKKVSFTENQVTRTGVADDIDDLGFLYVTLDSGEQKILSSGEISLRTEE